MSKSALALLLAFGLGGAIGFAISQLRGAESQRVAVGPEPSAPGTSAAQILAGDDQARRIIDVSSLLEAATPDALPSLREAIDASALDGGDPELALFGMWWAGFDPEAAYRWTRSDWRAMFGSVIGAVFRGWARRDPQHALDLATQLRFPMQRQLAVAAALAGWDESGRPGLVEAVAKLGPIDHPGAVAVLARRRVGVLGAEGGLRWLESIEDPEFRASMTLPVASAVAAVEGGGPVAAKWVEPRIAAAERSTGYPLQIAKQWVRHDPEAAMAWLSTLPAAPERDDAVAGAFTTWMYLGAGTEAFNWADRVELQPWNEPAIAAHARAVVVYGRAEEKLAVVARFTNTALRDATTVDVMKAWLDNDRDAALAWFARADLPEDVRQQVTAASVPRRGQAPIPKARAAAPPPAPPP